MTAAALHLAPEPGSTAALYVRRSHRDAAGSDRNGRSLAEQEVECRDLAARLGLGVVEIYSEREGTGASARSRKARPEWARALADLEDGSRFRTLIVWALDRADRRGAREVAALLDAHADGSRRVLGVDGTDTADPRRRMEIILRAEIAREEAERIAARVERTKRFTRDEGRWLGGPAPYGLRVEDGRVAHHPGTYPVARRIAEEALSGRSLWSIARGLNADSIPSPRAGKVRVMSDGAERMASGTWGVGTLSQLLRAPAFAGLQSVRERTASGGWRAVAEVYLDADRQPVEIGSGVITSAERSRILAHLEARTRQDGRAVKRGRREVTSLLGGVLRCAACGSRVATSGNATHRSYRCGTAANGRACPAPFTAPVEGLDEVLSSMFLRRLAATEPGDALLDEVAHRWALREAPEAAADAQAVREEIEALDADLARARRLAVSGVLTEDEAADEISRLRSLLDTARARLAGTAAPTADISPLLDTVLSREAWGALEVAERRALIGLAVREVRVTSAGGRGRRFRPAERVRVTWADGSETAPPADV